jgi:probable HAF family extracellular repeat protein
MEDVHPLGNVSSDGRAINNSGAITGQAGSQAFLASPGRPTMLLGTLGGTHSIGHDINDRGQVTGAADRVVCCFHAFVAAAGKPMIDVGTLGGVWSEGRAINNFGMVVGESNTSEGRTHAFLAVPITILFSELSQMVDGLMPGNNFTNAVSSARAYYEADDGSATCGALDLFIMKVLAHIGKKVPTAQAEALIENANDIKYAIGCN